MKSTVLILSDGRAVEHWVPRPNCYLAKSHYTAAEAAAKYPADYSDMSPAAAAAIRAYRLKHDRPGVANR